MPGPELIRRPVTHDETAAGYFERARRLVRKAELAIELGKVESSLSLDLQLAQVYAVLATVPRSRRGSVPNAPAFARLHGLEPCHPVPIIEPPDEPSDEQIEAAVEAIHSTRQLSSRQTAIAVLRAVQSIEGKRA